MLLLIYNAGFSIMVKYLIAIYIQYICIIIMFNELHNCLTIHEVFTSIYVLWVICRIASHLFYHSYFLLENNDLGFM